MINKIELIEIANKIGIDKLKSNIRKINRYNRHLYESYILNEDIIKSNIILEKILINQKYLDMLCQ